MREAYLIGAGQSDYGAFPDESYRSLFLRAYEEAEGSVQRGSVADAIDEAYIGMLSIGGRQIGLPAPAITEHVGLHGIPAVRLENACAASGYAVRQAVQAIRSGMADVVLAGGTEVMNDMSRDVAKYWLGVSGEMEWERMAGMTFSGVFAQMASAHLADHDTTREHLSKIAVKSHRNGAMNPHAHLGFECTVEDAESSPTVADPLTVYHCCPMSDGAAAVLVASEDVVDQYTDSPIRIAGVGAASQGVGLFQRDSYTSLETTRTASRQAYREAGLAPADLDLAEVHDCFSIAELIAYEDLGFCEPGAGGDLVDRGVTELDGDLPVNTSGGLKSKGHPIGATGAGQVVEVFEQLSGSAGDRQLDDPRYALTHNIGGSGGAAVVHIFEQEGAA